MQVRPATMADAEILYGWANDPGTRRWSFTTEPIPWETHVAWLSTVLADRVLLIGADDNGPVGSVRFDPDGEVSITIAPERRGRGLARSLLDAALPYGPSRVVAHVRPENIASMRLFAGWIDEGQVSERDLDVHRFVHVTTPPTM
jgi:RimJ/RimL family protein N-acetyltransferase